MINFIKDLVKWMFTTWLGLGITIGLTIQNIASSNGYVLEGFVTALFIIVFCGMKASDKECENKK